MRRTTILAVLTAMLLSFQAQSQIRNGCTDQYNAFLNFENLDSIRALVDTIYRSGIIYYKRDSATVFPELINIGSSDPDLEFVRDTVFSSSLDTTVYYGVYKEYYKGILVDGGGFTEYYYYGGPGHPENPCLAAYSVYPYVYTGMDFNPAEALPAIAIAELNVIDIIDSSELKIVNSQIRACEYNLVYILQYVRPDSSVSNSMYDALTGDFIKEYENYNAGLEATTYSYQDKTMNDSLSGGNYYLSRPDGRLTTYDYQGQHFTQFQFAAQDGLYPNKIYNPSVSDTNDDWGNAAAPYTYQTHWIADQLIGLFELDFKIVFKHCYFVANISGLPNALSHIPTNYLSRSVFTIGSQDDQAHNKFYMWAWPDIIGHEMTHSYLHYKLDSDEPGNNSLHEALADMFGIYFKARLLDQPVDWVMGSDLDKEQYERDFENLEHTCFTDVEDYGVDDPYNRGDPLRHWFYLCVNGDEQLEIPAIPIKTVLDIIIVSIPGISSKADYPDLMNATLAKTLEIYGRCSDEFIALSRAWEEICVPTGYADPNDHISGCEFTLEGPNYVYEEADYFEVCVVDAIPTFHYIWTLIGQQSTNYESIHGMSGNSQYGSSCLEITAIPEFNYYHQIVTIKVQIIPDIGPRVNLKKNILIVDRDGDDPTCQEYYDLDPFTINDNKAQMIKEENNSTEVVQFGNIENDILTSTPVQIFNILGQNVFSGDVNQIGHSTLTRNCIYIIKYLNSENSTYITKYLILDE